MAFFKNSFWGEKNAGFDVLYHNMKHGQIATKELAEFVRERAALEETYSKSVSKMAKMASNGSPLGTFAPMWDLFRISSDKLALCHLELMKKMNDLLRDINKYGEEQVKVHRKMKETAVGTLESVQALQTHSSQLHKARDGHLCRRAEVERLHREGAPQRDLEKAELKSKKAAASFSSCVENYKHVGSDFELKMSESAQKFQDIEEAHLRQMKQLIMSYVHSVEDTHVQVGQVYEEFKQNVENIGTEKLLQRFAEQKGTGKDRPTSARFEEHVPGTAPEGAKKTRGKSFRIPGLGRRDKEPGTTDFTPTEPLHSQEVDEEGFVIRTDGQGGCPQDREANFYSSDSDFDDDEPKKFHIRIRPASSGSRGSSAAHELELRATVGALMLPPNRGMSVRRHLVRATSCTADKKGVKEGAPHGELGQDGLRRSASSPDPGRLTAGSCSETLFGPPLESAFADPAFSSDSSSPDNVEDSGLDSPSHQPLGLSPDPNTWASWPITLQSAVQPGPVRAPDTVLTTFGNPSSRQTHPERDEPVGDRTQGRRSPQRPPAHPPCVPKTDPQQWNCKQTLLLDSFLRTHKRSASPAPPPPSLPRDARGGQARQDSTSVPQKDTRAFPNASASQREQDKETTKEFPILDSPEDPFSITMIGSPTHQSALAAATAWNSGSSSSSGSSRLTSTSTSTSGSGSRPRKDMMRWGSVHNPFSEGASVGVPGGLRDRDRRYRASDRGPRRNATSFARNSGPQEDPRVPADKEQSGFQLGRRAECHPASGHSTDTPPHPQRENAELLLAAPPQPARMQRANGLLSGCHMSRSVCSSPLADPNPIHTSSSSSSSPSEWGCQEPNHRVRSPTQATLPMPSAGLSRGPSPVSFTTQDALPVAAAITEYISAYFSGGEHSRCLVKITGDFTMSFPAGIIRVFAANPNIPVLSFRLVNLAQIDQLVPNQKLLYSEQSQSEQHTRDFWFNMQALSNHLQREAELNPQALYHNVGLVKYQVSSQDPCRAPLLLSAECQRGGTVTRVSLDYRSPGPGVAPSAQLTGIQVLLPLQATASDVQCQPPASWNAEEGWLLWKLPSFSSANHSQGPGRLCASWQCSDPPRGPPPSLGVQFLGSGASLSGLDVELVGSKYRLSLVKKRFATGKYVAACSV
uniref:FCH and mu domain containing endocytic adaptor 1 n=1 Tax=Paramormyrops kingsleyae TaxID=1676925 RepID=A0A3B3SZJ1_9TELE|nr:F-BAR domain only protein 1-like isoform X1 [Paramormyrops kingsleyae]